MESGLPKAVMPVLYLQEPSTVFFVLFCSVLWGWDILVLQIDVNILFFPGHSLALHSSFPS